MARPVDPGRVVDVIRQIHAEAERIGATETPRK
jgi:hypothetical protein